VRKVALNSSFFSHFLVLRCWLVASFNIWILELKEIGLHSIKCLQCVFAIVPCCFQRQPSSSGAIQPPRKGG
jgi:hypothetical protein